MAQANLGGADVMYSCVSKSVLTYENPVLQQHSYYSHLVAQRLFRVYYVWFQHKIGTPLYKNIKLESVVNIHWWNFYCIQLANHLQWWNIGSTFYNHCSWQSVLKKSGRENWCFLKEKRFIVILWNCFVLSCDFIYFIYVICLGKTIYRRRRHVGSGSYKEGGCKEKERGWQIWWSRVEIWSEIDVTPGNRSIGRLRIGDPHSIRNRRYTAGTSLWCL